MQLRPYQNEAKDAVLETWELGTRATVLVLPTGTGKTICFAKIAEQIVMNGGRVLVLAHREELLTQAADKIKQVTSMNCALEKAESCSLGTWYNITTGSIQSLQNVNRLEKFNADHFTHIIVDECHHSISKSYRRVLDYFSEAKVLGVTATVDRGDKRELGEFYQTIAYEYHLVDAIQSGFLVPIKAKTIPLNINLQGIQTQNGDFQAKAIGSALDPYLEQIADEVVKNCQDRKTVAFLPLIATSQKFCDLLNSKGFPAKEINGDSPDRQEILTDYRNGKYKILCNSMLLTEGWDEPEVDCIIVLRPTKVRSLFCQMVGRGTRLFPGKKDLLLLDFLWQTTKHDLCRAAHLICENDDIVDRVAEILAEESVNNEKDLLAEISEIESNAVEEREESLRKELEAQKHKKAKLVDVMQYEHSIDQKPEDYSPNPNNLYEQVPPSDAQLALIERYGINPLTVKCSGHASSIIDTIKKRQSANMSTPKQIRCLERQGYQNVGEWTFDQAKRIVARLAAGRWKPIRHGDGITPSNYKPE